MMPSLLHLGVLGVLGGSLLCSLAHARPKNCELRDGKMFIDGQWVFLKIAKPLKNYSQQQDCEDLIRELPILKQKRYNVIEINCYWHHFNRPGHVADMPLDGLVKLIDAIADAGMYPCLSVETYGVGGGQVPADFWRRHPDAAAIDSTGRQVKDDEYGVMSQVPSLFSPDYLRESRTFIRKLTRGVPHEKILWFETTVEPQFMGNHALDFSKHARREWEEYKKRTGAKDPAGLMDWPVPETVLSDPAWNIFRAEWLADWINGDAEAFREVAGRDAYIAVDYLETCRPDMRNRNGDSLTFLRKLTSPNIIQVNWHWRANDHKPNQGAYDNMKQVMRETGRAWAITEHMTINGTDYSVEDIPALLHNTIKQGTGFGWEFVSVTPESGNGFALYNNDWTPKPQMAVVDDGWDDWMREVRAVVQH